MSSLATNLTSYAKDALKNYVPQLRRTYNASELDDDHPVRFTNRGWNVGHSEEREHEFCWRVPQAGRGSAFWIPLRINPAHSTTGHRETSRKPRQTTLSAFSPEAENDDASLVGSPGL